jgi:hypothetical protein
MNSSDPPTTPIEADVISSTLSSPHAGHINWEALAGGAFVEFQNLVLVSLKQPLENLRYWSLLALSLAGLSTLAVIAGLVLAYYQASTEGSYAALSVASSGASILASVASTWISRYLAHAREDVAKTRQEVLELFREYGRKVFGQNDPSVFIYAAPRAVVGRFERLAGGEWVEVSLKEGKTRNYRFALNRVEGERIILRDSNRKIEVEIDQENRRVSWMKGTNKEFLYSIINVH